MWNAIKGILQSKKFLAALISVVVWGVGLFGVELSQAEVLGAVTPLWLYIIGQAVADHGKERAKVEVNGSGTGAATGNDAPDTGDRPDTEE